ncbi:acyl carrier protein [Paenibacillus sp. NPDC057934]|uniref:acyl carrier protein n=1 Tax=Paenibacillus sp. NPDC057934 TaxID=3346282 RepID=UPI0036DAABBA
MDNIKSKVLSIIKETLNESNIVPAAIQINDKLSDIGINSLSFIKIIVLLEEEFSIEFNDEQLDVISFESVENLCDYIIQAVDRLSTSNSDEK